MTQTAKSIAEIHLDHGEPQSPAQLKQYSPFEGITEATLQKYPGAVVLRKFKKGDIICREGEYGSTAFYITKGRVEIFLATPMASAETQKADGLFASGLSRWVRRFKTIFTGAKERKGGSEGGRRMIPIDAPIDLDRERPIAEMGEGDLFGEMTCLNFYPRSATVRATEDCEMLEMLRNILSLLQKRSQTFKKTLDQGYRKRAIRTHLRGLPSFEDMSDDEIESLGEKVELDSYAPGQVIVKQGDEADAAFLVRAGFVKVTQGFPGGELVVRYLHRGESFGAAGILGSGVRSATCTAVDHVELVRIPRDTVQELMGQSTRIRTELKKDLDRVKASEKEMPVVAVDLPLEEMLEKGLMQAQNLLLLDLEKCTRCDDCVRACADSHDGITRLVREGIRFDRYLVATSCRSCADPLCLVGCPVGSIHRNDSLEIAIEDWCIGCGLCAKQCPYGNINLHPIEDAPPPETGASGKKAAVKSKAVTCDLCAGLSEPSCVYACPHDAASRVDPQEFFSEHSGRTL